ncbi:uncharacterized protein LOC113496919 [Trichoplusia ni]|uniref:Uncharacterized protein LOC113496919 n=1 Tax=Trichoplusia ni TaxID=7111 RepID=A0A7E5VV16_TRINI|nr:uncharacterized protein LOC113496919 [Trichoplusia ni]
MKTKTIALFVFLCVVQFGSGDASRTNRHFFNNNKEDNAMDVTDFSIYYDLDTNTTIRKMMPRPWYQPGWRLRLPFRGGRCNCDGLKCNCCSGMRIPAFNFDRQTCADLVFDPNEGLLDLEVTMNNESIFHRSYSASNPPPFCIPIPVPYVPITILDMCIRLFDITIDFTKMHVCMDWDTRVDKAPVLILHFDCMNLGLGGISLTKPNTNQITGPGAPAEPPQLNGDVYDSVTENANVTTQHSVFNNSVKYI